MIITNCQRKKNETSIWNQYLNKYGKDSENHKVNVQVLKNKMKQFPSPTKKKKHGLSILKTMIRSIDYLCINLILTEFDKIDNIELIITFCSNHGLFINEIFKIQNNIHKYIMKFVTNKLW